MSDIVSTIKSVNISYAKERMDQIDTIDDAIRTCRNPALFGDFSVRIFDYIVNVPPKQIEAFLLKRRKVLVKELAQLNRAIVKETSSRDAAL